MPEQAANGQSGCCEGTHHGSFAYGCSDTRRKKKFGGVVNSQRPACRKSKVRRARTTRLLLIDARTHAKKNFFVGGGKQPTSGERARTTRLLLIDARTRKKIFFVGVVNSQRPVGGHVPPVFYS